MYMCLSDVLGRGEVTGDLLAGQDHTKDVHVDIGDSGLSHEIGAVPPVAHDDQDDCQRQKLADLDAHVEGQKVGKKPILGDLVFEDLVARPVPWNSPKISVAALLLG